MKNKILLGICIFILLVTPISAATVAYETASVSRILGNSPEDLIHQLDVRDLDLEHASYYEDNGLTYKQPSKIIDALFDNYHISSTWNYNDIDTTKFKSNELFVIEADGELKNNNIISKRLYYTQTQINPSDLWKKDFEDHYPLFIFDSDYAGLAIPKQPSFVNEYTRYSTIIAPTFVNSRELTKALLCNIGNEKTIGETKGKTIGHSFQEARNQYYENTRPSEQEMIGLTLMSYHLYGNPFTRITTPKYNEEKLTELCGELVGKQEIQAQEFSPTIQQSITIDYEIEDNIVNIYEDFNQDNTPLVIRHHDLPTSAIITKITNEFSNPVSIEVEQECEHSFENSLSYKQDKQTINIFISPLDCSTNQLYQTIDYEIEYISQSPIFFKNLNYPDTILPNTDFTITADLEYVTDQTLDGNIEVYKNNILVYQKEIATNIPSITIPLKSGTDDISNYELVYKEDKILTETQFQIKTNLLNINLQVPDVATETADISLFITNNHVNPVEAQIADNLILETEKLQGTLKQITLQPGTNEITYIYNNLKKSDTKYKLQYDIAYENKKEIINGLLLTNRKPIFTPTNIKVKETQTINIQNLATDQDGDTITYTYPAEAPNGIWNTVEGDQGIYELKITADDDYEQSETTIIAEILPKNIAPELEQLEDLKVMEGDLLTISLYAYDEDNDPLTYEIEEFELVENNYEWQTLSGDEGTYTITYSVDDTYDTVEKQFEVEIVPEGCTECLNNKPILEDLQEITVDETETVTIEAIATDEDLDTLTYEINSENFDKENNIFTWETDYDDAGTHKVIITVSDGLSQAQKEVTITINNLNRPPTLTIINPEDTISISEQESIEFEINAIDPDNDILTTIWYIDGEESKTFSILSTEQFTTETDFDSAGPHTVKVEINDGQYTKSHEWNINVDNTNRKPILNPIGDIEVTETDTITITPVANDPDGDEITYEISDSRFENINHEFIYKTTYDDAITKTITITASDGQDEVSQDITLTIINKNRPPTIDDQEFTYTETDLINPTIATNDPDGEEVTVTILDEKFQDNNWQSTYDDSGTYTITVEATDGIDTVTKDLTLTITNKNRLPTLEHIPKITVKESETIIIDPIISDPDNNNEPTNDDNDLTVSIDNIFTEENNKFIWNTNYDDSGSYQATITVSDGQDQVQQTIDIEIENINRPPTLQPIADIEITEDDNIVIIPLATDPDNNNEQTTDDNILTYAINDPRFTQEDDKFTYKSNYDDSGTYDMTIQVSDGEFTISQDFTLTILNKNRAPELPDFEALTATETNIITINQLATDPDNNNEPTNDDNTLTYTTDILFEDLEWQTDYDSAGTYTVLVTVSDGELETTKPLELTIINKNRLPIIEEQQFIYTETDLINPIIETSDPDGDQVTYTILGFVDNSWQTSYDDSGTYTITVEATDGIDTVTKDLTLTILNKNRPPTIDDQEFTYTETDLINPTITTNDLDGEQVIVTILDEKFKDNNWQSTYDDSGIYTITVEATDGEATVTKDLTLTIINKNRLPIIEEQQFIYTETDLINPIIKTSDPDNNEVTYTILGFTDNQWQTTYDDSGTYTITVEATDGIDTVTKYLTLTILNKNRAPILTSIPSQVIDENKVLNIPIEVYDPDGDTLTITSNAPIVDNHIVWRPQEGHYKVTVQVSDGEATVETIFDLFVDEKSKSKKKDTVQESKTQPIQTTKNKIPAVIPEQESISTLMVTPEQDSISINSGESFIFSSDKQVNWYLDGQLISSSNKLELKTQPGSKGSYEVKAELEDFSKTWTLDINYSLLETILNFLRSLFI